MSAEQIKLKIITPDGLFWDSLVDLVTVKTTEGYIGIMAGKSPLVASLDIAELTINKRGSDNFKDCAIAGGLIYASPTKVDIITDAIEYKENIDLARAEKKKKSAELKLKQKLDHVEMIRANKSLKKAINRIAVKRE